jgi:RNA polymerase sigma factor (sigma-70 family)
MPSPAALDDRIARNHPALVAFLERRAAGEGEELAQEVWLRIARLQPRCPTEAEFRGYAWACARRLLIDGHRRRQARPRLVALDGGFDPGGDFDPAAQVASAQILSVVEATLARMKPELAEVFRLRTTSAVSFVEIARRQGVPLGTALGRMHQATHHLHAALAAAGLLPDGASS